MRVRQFLWLHFCWVLWKSRKFIQTLSFWVTYFIESWPLLLGFFRTIPKSCIKAGGKSSQTKRHFLNGIGWSTRGRSDCQNIYCVDAITSMSFPAWLKSFTAVEYTIFIIKFSFTLTSYAFTASLPLSAGCFNETHCLPSSHFWTCKMQICTLWLP